MMLNDDPASVVGYVVRVAALWLFFRSVPALAMARAAWSEGLGQTASVLCGGVLAASLWIAARPLGRWLLRRASSGGDRGALPYHMAISLVGLMQLILMSPRFVQSISEGISWHRDQAVRWSTALLTNEIAGDLVAAVLAVVCILVPAAVARVGGDIWMQRRA